MDNGIPNYIDFSFAALVFAMLGVLLGIVYGGAKRMKHSKPHVPVIMVGFVVLVWLGVLAALAYSGFFANFTSLPPRVFISIVVPIIAIVLFARSKRARDWLDHVPGHWLVYAQLFRLPVEIALWALFVEQIIPIQMTFEGFNFDVLTALTAPVIGYLYYARRKLALRWVTTWNIMGLLLVTVIVVIASLSTPSPLRMFDNEPANTMVAHLPYIWLPGFLVPLAVFLHVASLKQLLRGPIESYPTHTDADN